MYPKAYIEFLVHFHGTRDYFECHEVLEEHWKATEPKDRDSVWVLFIQIAVSLYHYRRNNLKGAGILISKCIKKLPYLHKRIEQLGIHAPALNKQIRAVQEQISHHTPYQSFQLPIRDPELLKQVRNMCREWGVSYESVSDSSNTYLVHKHILRNRTQ